MTDKKTESIDPVRRRLLGTTGAGLAAAAVGGISGPMGKLRAETSTPLRWGIVGTGMIANSMARTLKLVPAAKLGAISEASTYCPMKNKSTRFRAAAGFAAGKY